MIMVVFRLFFVRFNFSFFQSKLLVFYDHIYIYPLAFFVFGSIGLLPRVVGLVGDRKVLKACLLTVFVFPICFSQIEFLIFSSF